MIRNFISWLNEQEAPAAPEPAPAPSPSPAPMPAPPMGGSPTPPTGAPGKEDKISAILIKHPITTLAKVGDTTIKQFNQYDFTLAEVDKWLTDAAKTDKLQILHDYLNGRDSKPDKIYSEFADALKNKELGDPITTIDIEFTKDGSPTTKDINLVFL